MSKVVTTNKRARRDYDIDKTYEAGIKLVGSEIKSIRKGEVNLSDSYVTIRNYEAFLINMHVSKYDQSSTFNHEETRTRKLLLNKREIITLFQKSKEQGYAIIPLKLYFKGQRLKVEIALAKGRRDYDKREYLKEKDSQMRIKKQLKYYDK